jgi:hypothetical protein
MAKICRNGIFVREGLEKGVEAQLTGERTPDVPNGNGTGGTTSRDSRLDCFLSSAEVTAETICLLGVQTCGPIVLREKRHYVGKLVRPVEIKIARKGISNWIGWP